MAEVLTEETALAAILDPKNCRQKVWTATILLDRMGINRSPVPYAKWSKANRLKAKRILDSLWRRGQIVRVPRPDTRNSYLAGSEIAYRRVQDAPGEYLVPCCSCGEPCLFTNEGGGQLVVRCGCCGAERSHTLTTDQPQPPPATPSSIAQSVLGVETKTQVVLWKTTSFARVSTPFLRCVTLRPKPLRIGGS